MTIDDALDGKLDMVRRFAVDVAALTERRKRHIVNGTLGELEVRDPVSRSQIEELHYDAQMIQHAEVFAWDEKMGQMVRESAKKFPSDIPFSRAWLYTPSGIWWFGRDSRLLALRSTELDPSGGEIRRAGCALSFWSQRNHPENICLWGYSYDHLEPTSGPVPVTNVILKGGETLADLYKEWMAGQTEARTMLDLLVGEAMHKLDVASNDWTWPIYVADKDDLQGTRLRDGARKQRIADKAEFMASLHEMRERGESTWILKVAHRQKFLEEDKYRMAMSYLKKLAWIRSSQKLVTFFLAGSLWIQQKVLVYSAGTMTRHARKRAERVQIVPKVNVVELRRREYTCPPGTEGHKDVEWSCSWLVRGHWRNQFYPSTSEHRPIWIDPFVKGDPDKPFKGTDRVFAVRR